MPKVLQFICVGLIMLLAGIFIGHDLPQRVDVATTLEKADQQLNFAYQHDDSFNQTQLTTISAYMVNIMEMQIDWLSLKLCNHPKYKSVEHELRDIAKTHKKEEIEGSIVPFESNMERYNQLSIKYMLLKELEDKIK